MINLIIALVTLLLISIGLLIYFCRLYRQENEVTAMLRKNIEIEKSHFVIELDKAINDMNSAYELLRKKELYFNNEKDNLRQTSNDYRKLLITANNDLSAKDSRIGELLTEIESLKKSREFYKERFDNDSRLSALQRKFDDLKNELIVAESISESRRISMEKMGDKIEQLIVKKDFNPIDRLIAMDKAGDEFIEDVKNELRIEDIKELYLIGFKEEVDKMRERFKEIKKTMNDLYWESDSNTEDIIDEVEKIIDKPYK